MGITRAPHQRALKMVVRLLTSYLASIAAVNGIGGDEVSTDGESYYTEDLTLQRLGQRHVAARFVFRSTWMPKDRHRCQEHEDWPREETMQTQTSSNSAGKLCHFEAVFPRAMGVLLDRFEVRQLSLQMSKGRWDTVAWGNGPDDGGEYTPGGAEMWARLPHEGAWESWVGLRRSLSGLYCASLDGMDDSRVHTPAVMTLPGETASSSNTTVVLRGTLPREPVCTENLIPLIKMLPCRSKTGLGGLLHPTRIFQSDYHSVSVRATATFSDGGDGNRRGSITSLTLEQNVLAVFRPRPHLPSAVPRSRMGIAREGESAGDGWSILTLLLPPKSVEGAAKSGGSVPLQGCSVASRSAIHVRGVEAVDRSRASCLAEECDAFQETSSIVDDKLSSGVIVTRRLGSSPAHQVILDDEDGALESISHFLRKNMWEFDIETGGVFPATRVDEGRASDGEVPASPGRPVADARLENFFAGRGGSRGVSVSHLVNMHPEEDAYTEFLQPVPYFMVPLLGSLRARVVTSCSSVQPPLGDHSTAPEADDAASMGPWNDSFSWQSCGGGGERNGHASLEPPGPVLGLAQNLSFTPGDGCRPAIVEARLWVPAASTLVLGFDFLKRFLTVDDFPPDPSRGFDVPPPLAKFYFPHSVAASCPAHGNDEEGQKEVATTSCAAAEGADFPFPGRVVYAYGDAGLLDAPQPDFSMPFNVITFTSTIITFFLGTMINLLVRKSARRPKDRREASSERGDRRGRFGRAREAFRNAFGVRNRWRRRGPEEIGSSPQESSG